MGDRAGGQAGGQADRQTLESEGEIIHAILIAKVEKYDAT